MTEREAIVDQLKSIKDNCDDYLEWGETKMFIDRMSHSTIAPSQELVVLMESMWRAGYNLASSRSISAAESIVYEANEKDAAQNDYGQFEQEFLNK
jgi:hypothetical protein